jgi:hypothetical protein
MAGHQAAAEHFLATGMLCMRGVVDDEHRWWHGSGRTRRVSLHRPARRLPLVRIHSDTRFTA